MSLFGYNKSLSFKDKISFNLLLLLLILFSLKLIDFCFLITYFYMNFDNRLIN